jgi:hypothetical protein
VIHGKEALTSPAGRKFSETFQADSGVSAHEGDN